MQALYHGKEQARLLVASRVEEMLRQQSIKQGIAYDNPATALAHINDFVKQYEINTEELLNPSLTDYKTFNEFFYRALKPGARPVAAPEDAKVVSSAADCRLTVFESVEAAKTLWIKVRTLPSLFLPFSLISPLLSLSRGLTNPLRI